MSHNTVDLYAKMEMAIRCSPIRRRVSDPESPNQRDTYEAWPGERFELSDITDPLPMVRDNNVAWACANVLHFFYGGTKAEALRKYNKDAGRFLTMDGEWIGAYGSIAMPQVRDCIRILTADPWSRRAVVQMGGPSPSDINRPACISFLHFLNAPNGLYLRVDQRSLLLRLMPYDCAVLCNLLNYVSYWTKLPVGHLIWTVGSLHAHDVESRGELYPKVPLLLDPRDLHCSNLLYTWLENPELAPQDIQRLLARRPQ